MKDPLDAIAYAAPSAYIRSNTSLNGLARGKRCRYGQDTKHDVFAAREANEAATHTCTAISCISSQVSQKEGKWLFRSAIWRLYAPSVHKISPNSCLITRSILAPRRADGHFFEISRRCLLSFLFLRFLAFACLYLVASACSIKIVPGFKSNTPRFAPPHTFRIPADTHTSTVVLLFRPYF